MALDTDYYEQQEVWDEDHIADSAVIDARLDATAAMLPTDTGRLLDVGAGDGRFIERLVLKGHERADLVSIERSSTAMRRHHTAHLRASADHLPFADRSFGTVTALEVIEHLPVGVYETTLVELGRVADRHILLTVPNRERIERAHVVCPNCHCRYSPTRHLRSFRPESFEGLVPGFRPVAFDAFGPRAYVYPRLLRQVLEQRGLLEHPGYPSCPQCGAPLKAPRAGGAPSPATSDPTAAAGDAKRTGAPTPVSLGQRAYRIARRASPRSRHPYFLAALLRRDS